MRADAKLRKRTTALRGTAFYCTSTQLEVIGCGGTCERGKVSKEALGVRFRDHVRLVRCAKQLSRHTNTSEFQLPLTPGGAKAVGRVQEPDVHSAQRIKVLRSEKLLHTRAIGHLGEYANIR